MRKRRTAREATLLGLTRQDNLSIIASVQRKRQNAGLSPLIHDQWCQLSAEILACEILADYYRDKKWELSNERHKLDYVVAEESVIKKGQSLLVGKKVTRIGLVKLPADCKVSAVVVTSKH